jgi:integrase
VASNLSIATVKAAKPRETEYLLADGRQGLYLRVLPSGTKSWIYKYKLDDKARKYSLGVFPDLGLADARDAHAAARLIVRKGQDPAEPPPPNPDELTIAKLIETYKKYSKENKAEKTSSLEGWGLDKYVLPFLGKRLAKEIRRADAIKLIESIGKDGMAAQILKHARAMFTYALNREYVEYNPFSSIASAVPAIKRSSRSRILEDSEIKHLWAELTNITDPRSLESRRALLLILTTGQRPEEVTGLHSREIQIGVDKQRCKICRRCGWWTIPWERIKTRSTRKEDHRLFLSPLALRLIGDGAGNIFKGPRDEIKPLQRQALSHYVVDHKQFNLPHWTPHDLRRSCATGLARIGCPDEIIDAILNHAKKGIIGIYNQYKYDKEKENWLIKWSDHLHLISNTQLN